MVFDSIKKSFGVFPDVGNNDQKTNELKHLILVLETRKIKYL